MDSFVLIKGIYGAFLDIHNHQFLKTLVRYSTFSADGSFQIRDLILDGPQVKQLLYWQSCLASKAGNIFSVLFSSICRRNSLQCSLATSQFQCIAVSVHRGLKNIHLNIKKISNINSKLPRKSIEGGFATSRIFGGSIMNWMRKILMENFCVH